jgi:hypothetical protein
VPLALLGAGGRARWHPPPDPLADRGLGAGRPGSVPAGGDAGN